VLDHLLLSIQPQSFLELVLTSLEYSVVEFCIIRLEEHLQVSNRTLESDALDTPNNVAVFVTDAPAKRTNDLSSFKIDQGSHFPILYIDCHSIESLMH
jgi:hypothetical protein